MVMPGLRHGMAIAAAVERAFKSAVKSNKSVTSPPSQYLQAIQHDSFPVGQNSFKTILVRKNATSCPEDRRLK